MTFIYIVRCNFTEPAKEQAWNAWYGGPKIAQMLAQPHFRACQRFHLASGTGRNYLALWTLDSPQALATPQYVSQWGFAEWAPFITDWSRDLFDGGLVSDDALAVAPHGALKVASFDAMDAEGASAARTALARADPALMWLPVIGLDRHTPHIGLRPLLPRPVDDGSDQRAQCALYRPISGYHRASRAAS